jgi:hypothetical protein
MLLSGLEHDSKPSDRLYILSLLTPSEKSLECLCDKLHIDVLERNNSYQSFCQILELLISSEEKTKEFLKQHLNRGKQLGMSSLKRIS